MEMVVNKFSEDLKTFLKKHPQMRFLTGDGLTALNGKVVVEDKGGYIWDSFEVFMLIPPCYPYCFPLVWETSGKIPQDIDWHVVLADKGRLCLCAEPEERIICKKGITLDWFMQQVLIPHLASQTHKLRFGKYPHGERAHGIEGVWQYYLEIFQTDDFNFVLKCITLSSLGLRPRDNEQCLCGSRKSFANCHSKAFSLLEDLGKEYLRTEIGKLTAK